MSIKWSVAFESTAVDENCRREGQPPEAHVASGTAHTGGARYIWKGKLWRRTLRLERHAQDAHVRLERQAQETRANTCRVTFQQ
eukprot:352770-Chlamydomonas_euryale.AAC.2